MELTPVVLVTPEQIAAATRIHDNHMPGWATTDRALALLAESVPGLQLEAVMLKAAAVDRLYSTRHFRLGEAIERIMEVMADPSQEPIALVEAIAPIEVGGKVRRHWSFASKFAHWFLDNTLPIYDRWAIEAVWFHFDGLKWATTRYRDFAEHVFALRDASGLSCTSREMDRYLWLSGMYRARDGAENKDNLGLSQGIVELFESRDASIQSELAALIGHRRSLL